MSIKRVIRHLQKFPSAVLKFSGRGEPGLTRVWLDNDWAGDTDSRRYCSGGWIELEGSPICHWSKAQSNIALSSGEVGLNATVKGISEGIGTVELYREMYGSEFVHARTELATFRPSTAKIGRIHSESRLS